MEEQPGSQYCPHGQIVQRSLEFLEGGAHVRGCQVCRFPFGTSRPLKLQASLGDAGVRGIKILCVDDEPLTRQMIGDILRAEGYTVVMPRTARLVWRLLRGNGLTSSCSTS